MKRLSYLLIAFLAMVIMTGCENGNVAKLKRNIDVANAACPISYGIGGDLLSIKYHESDNTVLMYFSVNEEISSHVFLAQNKDNLLKQFRLSLSRTDTQEVLKDIVNAKASLMVIYKVPSTGKTIKLSLPYEELKEIKNSPLSQWEIKKMMLENSVTMQNTTLPSKVSEGMILTKVAIEDDNVAYYCQMDEDLYDIKAMQKMPEILKDAVRQEMVNMRKDPTIQQELQLLNTLGIGYKYHCYGEDSNEYVDVIFTSDELESYISR